VVNDDDLLASLVTANPVRAAVLDRFGLDYCCHGDRTLADAAGDDLDEVRATLEAADERSVGGVVGWADLPLPALLDHLVATHHAWLRDEVPPLLPLARKVQEVHGSRHPELAAVVQDLDRLWSELEPHLVEEEESLFPRIAAGDEVDVAAIRAEHESVGELLDDLRRLTGGYALPPDGCASYGVLLQGLAALDADTRLHVHKENNLVLGAV
jgi:regulator of cell morphogenesis and NO signaling